MTGIPPPYEKFMMFIERLNIEEQEIDRLRSFAPVFIQKKDEFADYFQSVFQEITETRIILEHEEKPGFLKKVWAEWFESLVTRGLDRTFHFYLWRVGLRHVEVGLDQRYSNLGFSLVRQFCQKIIRTEIPAEDRLAVTVIIDSLIDLCLLIETSAFIEGTTRCNLEVIRGIADKVRNPVAIIGGNIRRLQKKIDAGNSAYVVYDDLIAQTMRLDRMVHDISTYNEMFSRDQEFAFVHPEAPILSALDLLKQQIESLNVKVEMALENVPFVKVDRRDMDHLFYCLLQNSLDAVDREKPLIRITSPAGELHYGLKIEIFNTGAPPKEQDLDKLASPFYSTKAEGTGFGLAIAQLAVKRNFGKLSIESVEGEGTTVTVVLPVAAS
jgi:signal transduction histidine kinase